MAVAFVAAIIQTIKQDTPMTDVLFQLVAICYCNKPRARYPRFRVYRQTIGYFHSLRDAERRVMECVAEVEQAKLSDRVYHDYYGFEIHELPIGATLSGGTQRTRTYLHDGSLWHESRASSIEDAEGILEPFMGREESECRFKVGDLVEVLRGDMVTLEVVYALPPSPERVEEIHHKTAYAYAQVLPEVHLQRLCELDYSDDSYVTLDGGESYMANHSHPLTIQLFPVRLKIPPAIADNVNKIAIFSKYKPDVTIVLPSNGILNKDIAKIANKMNSNALFINDLLVKMTTEEVRDMILLPNSLFRKTYNTRRAFETALSEFDNYVDHMENDIFRVHYIKDPQLRTTIEQTIRIEWNTVAKYFDAINDRYIFIVDDGTEDKESVIDLREEILTYYSPKSITVLTLFADKFDNKTKKKLLTLKKNY